MTIKAKTYSLITMTLCMILFTSCTFEVSSNGDLDGYWHIEQIENLLTNEIKDMHYEHRFWAIQNHLLEFRNTDTKKEYLLRFNHDGNTLTVSDPYVYTRIPGYEPNDELIEDPEILYDFGCFDLKVKYNIETLNSSYMTLNDGKVRVKFRKL